jgi:hypothetical protein
MVAVFWLKNNQGIASYLVEYHLIWNIPVLCQIPAIYDVDGSVDQD